MSTNRPGAEVLSAAAEAHPAFAAAVADATTPVWILAALAAEGLEHVDLDDLDRHLAFLAWLVGRAAGATGDPARRLAALRQVLAVEEGFAGNHEQYHDPRNSYLPQVMERKVGLPITVSVIYLAVAERLGWPLVGVDYPRHFLVRYQEPDALWVIDPFAGGTIIDLARCAELARPAFGDLSDDQLLLLARQRLDREADPRRLTTRVLRNLEGVFLHRVDYPAARNVLEKRLLLDPEDPGVLRNLGGVLRVVGEHHRALDCLRGYLAASPVAADRLPVERMIEGLQRLLDEENA